MRRGVAIAIAVVVTAACGGRPSATRDCEPAQATIAFDSHPGGYLDLANIHLIDADGTNRRLLAQDAGQPAWSPDGCRIAFAGDDLSVVDADGSGLRKLNSGGGWPVWSSDGDRIAVTITGEVNSTQTSHIDVLNSDGSGRRRLVPFQAGDPSWSPDGSRIAFARSFTISSTDLYVVDADGSDLRRLTRGSRRGFDADLPAWSPDGRKIAFAGGAVRSGLYLVDIYVIDADGTGLQRVTTSPADPGSRGDYPFAWSPDGQRIAFVRRSDLRGVDIYVVRADGTRLRRLTRSGDAAEPAWSPDGSQIVFARTVTERDYDQADIYVINADGSGLRRLTKTPDLEAEPVWSPQ